MLTFDEKTRYSRHLLLPEFGEEGQRRLKESSVLVVGAGGLGSGALMYMAAAGIGRIGIVEFDTVDLSNLHRQILYGTDDVGASKLSVASRRLHDINPLIDIELHETRLTSENALDLISDYDIVADGTDNFATRYLVNDACVLTSTPNVFASIFRFDGQLAVFGAENGPCYRCLFPQPPPAGSVPSCAEGGVLGVLPGILGILQATEVIKMLAGLGEPLIGKMLLIDALTMHFKTLRISRDVECAACGERPTIDKLIDYESFCAGIDGSDPASHSQILPAPLDFPPHASTESNNLLFSPQVSLIDVHQLKEIRESGEDFLLLDVRQPEELSIADIGGVSVPMNELPERLDEVAPDKKQKIVVMCRSGVRSANVAAWLGKQDYENVLSLDGGILAWSQHIDSTIAVY